MNSKRVLSIAVALIAIGGNTNALADRDTATIYLSEATASIRAAERNGADKLAPIELKMARDNFSAANADADRRRWSEAEKLAVRALRDAELADAKTRAVRAEQSLAELKAVVDTLREELADDGEQE